MERRIIQILLFTFFFQSVLFAQDFKFGEVTADQLRERFYHKDSAAPAAILYKKGLIQMHDGDQMYFSYEVSARIKIYSDRGKDFGTISIPMYTGSSAGEKLITLEAYAYNLVNGEVEKEVLNTDSVTVEVINKYRKVKKITFPGLKPGSVIEYNYKINSPFISFLPEWQFQYLIPVDQIEYETRIPEFMNVKDYNRGELIISRKQTTEAGAFTLRLFRDTVNIAATTADKRKIDTLKFAVVKTRYYATDVPGLADGGYVNNIENYLTAVGNELVSSRIYNSQRSYFGKTWDSIANWIYRSPGFRNELHVKGYFEDDTDKLIASVDDSMERTMRIFNFITQKMKWNGNYGFTSEAGVRKAYQENSGNVADLNFILISMLRYAGVNASPVLLSTRENGVPLLPDTSGFNYVICSVHTADKLILLDATSKYSMPDILPLRVLNWKGRLIKEDGSSYDVELIPNDMSLESVNIMASLNANGLAEGKYRKHYTGHSALNFREQLADKAEEESVSGISNSFGGIVITDYDRSNIADPEKPVTESFSFKMEGAAVKYGDRMSVSPALFLGIKENPFKLEKRNYPVDFGFPKSEKAYITLKLPDGYKVEMIPEPMVLLLPDDLGSFKCSISERSGMIQVEINSVVNKAVISPLYYKSLKEFYKQIVIKLSEKIVLIKI